MPHKEEGEDQETTLVIKPLHPTFAAEILAVDFSKPISPSTFAQIKSAIARYGVLRFPSTGLDDEGHIAFARLFGDLDDVTPYNVRGKKHRLSSDYLFDVSNLLEDGSIAPLTSHRAAMNKGNTLFHVDSSFNPRRAGFSLLKAHTLPPPELGGATDFADTRAAWDDLDEDLKEELLREDYVACHSLYHSRKTASPEALPDLKPEEHFMSRHRLAQIHEASGRRNLYVASHVHHIEGVSTEKSRALIEQLYGHACQSKYVVAVPWENPGDLVVWDNTCVMHRSTGGGFEGKYVRDMRRATVHDDSSQAWGLNEQSSERMGFP